MRWIQQMSLQTRISDFFGLKRSIVALLAMVIFVGSASGWPSASCHLPAGLGGGELSIGLLNGMQNLLSALYSFPGGYLSDRLGYKKALIVFNLIAMFGYLIVILFPYWQAVIIGSLFFLSWSAVSLPATMSLVSGVLPMNKRTMGVTMHSLSGGFRWHWVRSSAVFSSNCTGRRMVCDWPLPAPAAWPDLPVLPAGDDPGGWPTEEGGSNAFPAVAFHGPRPEQLFASDILIRFAEQIPYAFVVVWCIRDNGITPVQFGILTTIEMATAVLVYFPVAYMADRTTKKPFVVITFFYFTLFPWSCCSPLLQGHGHRVHHSGNEGVRGADAQGPDHGPRAGRQEGGHVRAVLPDPGRDRLRGGLCRAFLWQVSPELNLLTATVCGLIGTIYFWIFGKDLKGYLPDL